MYEQLVYVGSMQQVKALDFEFTRLTPTPVPPRVARKLLRSPEFLTLEAHTARLAALLPPPPASEPVIVTTPALNLKPSLTKGAPDHARN